MFNCPWLIMVSSLAVIGLIRALSIDNQLIIVKNDCYERLAIGHKLNSKDVFKTFNDTALTECQTACTKEKSACRAFSFGISTTGNSTCLLSHEAIKETVDLKPIGTIQDTDFDLYIKKLGCSVVTDKVPHEKPVGTDDLESAFKPDTLGNIRPNDKYDINTNNEQHKPTDYGYLQTPSYGTKPEYGSVSNQYLPVKPPHNNGDKVQTLVSVASGPDSYYHPVHDILVSDKHEYGNSHDKIDSSYGNRLPLRPDSLRNPYSDNRPGRLPGNPSEGYDRPPPFRPVNGFNSYDDKQDCDKPEPLYGLRPDRPTDYGMSPAARPPLRPKPDGYDNPNFDRPLRPRPDSYDRPITRPEGYGDSNFDRPIRPSIDGYERPIPEPSSEFDRPNRPRPDGYDRPIPKPSPDGYGTPIPDSDHRPVSFRPRPDEYDRPDPILDSRPYGPRPRPDGYGGSIDARPTGPKPRPDGYDRPDPSYDLKPRPDGYGDPRPILPKPRPDGYGDPRPILPKPRPDGYDRPSRPKPLPDNYGGPNQIYDSRPISNPDGYDRPDAGFHPITTLPKPNGYEGVRPIEYYESSYSGFSSMDKFYTGYGMGNVDRYDVFPERPFNNYQNKPSKPLRPESGYGSTNKPSSDNYGSTKPQSNNYLNNEPPKDYMFGPNGNGYDNRPSKPPIYGQSNEDNPNFSYDRPNRPNLEPQGYGKPSSSGSYNYGKPSQTFGYEDNKKPSTNKPSKGDYDKPSKPNYPVAISSNKNEYGNTKGGSSSVKPIISHSIGTHGEQITSIITELKDGEYYIDKM